MRRLSTAAGLSTLSLLALLASACSSTPAASTGTATTVLNIGLPTSATSFANADVAVAQAEGYFRAEGLTVHVKNLASGVPVVQGVVGGSLDIGATSFEPVANADAQGGNLVIIGSYTDRLTVSMVTPDSIHSPAELRGKRLGIQTVGAFREVMTRMILAGAGLTPADATYVPVASTGYISALLQGSIQSAILQQEQVIDVLQKDAKLHVLVNLYQARPYYFYGTYVVSRPWLAHHQSVAEKFLTAIVRAHRFMYQHEAATVRTVAVTTGFSQQVIKQAYAVLLGKEGVFPVNQGLEPSRISQTIATMRQHKVLTGPAPAESTLVDAGPIDAVVHKLGAWTGDPRWH
jgi:ABC-type nitrate/sulfonate/bicarbonate transport system substrate-binding protein